MNKIILYTDKDRQSSKVEFDGAVSMFEILLAVCHLVAVLVDKGGSLEAILDDIKQDVAYHRNLTYYQSNNAN